MCILGLSRYTCLAASDVHACELISTLLQTYPGNYLQMLIYKFKAINLPLDSSL